MFTLKKAEKLNLKKLFRYDDKKNAFIIDISIDYYRDLYNDWDYSPFKRRDLDADLVTFIEESSEEIPLKYKLIINFFMPLEMRDETKEIKSKNGLRNYFKYRLYKIQGERIKYRKRAFGYALTGISLVLTALFIQKYTQHGVYLSVLPEGFVIGGWVFIWEMFTILFFQNTDRKERVREFQRLIEAEVNYCYYEESNFFEKL